MKTGIWIAAIVVLVGALGYWLYTHGVLTAKTQLAWFYRGSASFGRDEGCIRVTCSGCSGINKRVIQLEQGQAVRFVLSQNLNRGRVRLRVQDREGGVDFHLDNDHPCETVSAAHSGSFSVTVKLKQADGSFELHWDSLV